MASNSFAAQLWPQQRATPASLDGKSVEIWSSFVATQLSWLREHSPACTSLQHPAKGGLLGVAVLIEPREHAHTEYVLRNFAHFLQPAGWAIAIVHGTRNKLFMERIVKLVGGAGNIQLINCGADDLPPSHYNRLLTTASFWTGMPHENILLFQTDTTLLQAWTHAHTALLDYDYVGAPWRNTCFVCQSAIVQGAPSCNHKIDHSGLLASAPNLVGNGGLSLRKRSAMAAACGRFRLHNVDDARMNLGVENEDVFFALALPQLGYKVAPRALAADFAVEECTPISLELGKPCALGLHKVWAYHSSTVTSVLLSGCRTTS